MLGPVNISLPTKDLFKSLQQVVIEPSGDIADLCSWLEGKDRITEIDLSELVIWLSKTISLENEAQFLWGSLRASLLHDLYHSIPKNADFNDEIEQPSNGELFEFLTIAGTIVAICTGFDGIASILGLFPFIPATLIFFSGIVFAALSVIVFRGFDLVAMAQNLGVELENTPHAIDVFLEQVVQIEKIRALISICCTDERYERDHALLKQISNMLTLRYEALDKAREAYKEDLNAPYLKTAKSLTSAIAGVLFFGSGFFSGQAVFSAIASIFITEVSALFWPIIVASFIVGVAALSIYWFIERPGLESIVSRWLDIDEDKINTLVADEVVKEQKRGLHQLAKQVDQLGRFATHPIPVRDWRPEISAAPSSYTTGPFFKRPRARSVGERSELRETTEQRIAVA